MQNKYELEEMQLLDVAKYVMINH